MIKKFENFSEIDPYGEERWEELILIDFSKEIQDVPDKICNKIVMFEEGKFGILNDDNSKLLRVGKKKKKNEYFPDIKYEYIIDQNLNMNNSYKYELIRIKINEFNKKIFEVGDVVFTYCPPNDTPDINDIENYHIFAGIESVGNHSIYSYHWVNDKPRDDWGANYYWKIKIK